MKCMKISMGLRGITGSMRQIFCYYARMGVQDFFFKQMLQKQLAGLPKDQQEKLLKALSENPEFFKSLADEIAERTKRGETQMSAVMAVVGTKKAELSRILGVDS